MNQMVMGEIQSILQEFGLQADYIEKIGKVYKVHSDGIQYGLKGIDVTLGDAFLQHIQLLYQKGYYRFVPVYPAKNGQIMVLRGRKLYYLMPWLPNQRPAETDTMKYMFRELARLHGITTKEVDNTVEAINSHYGKVRLLWIREMDMFDQFMEMCERKVYMSPFEGEFVQYYHEIIKAYEYALDQLKNWKETASTREKIRVALCHSSFLPDHFVFDERGYGHFINMEKCKWSMPFKETLPYLIQSLRSYPKKGEHWVDWIFHYMKYYPLREDEKYLFKSYLAHPGHFLPTLRKYQERKIINHELEMTKRLQKNYWLFKNIEWVVMRMEEVEREQQRNKGDGHS